MSDDKTRILTAEDARRLAAMAEPADDRTRVLSAEEVARIRSASPAAAKPVAAGATPEPRLVGDKIVFFCANGHRIAVDRGLAGKRGVCRGKKDQGCGVAFVIPTPPGCGVPADSGPPPEDAAVETALPADGGVTETALPELQLAGPAAPEPEAVATEPEPVAEAAEPGPVWDFGTGEQQVTDAGGNDAGPPVAEGAVGWAPDLDEIDNPTARLVGRLWMERAHGGIVEIHLSGGSVIMPQWYDPRWSCGAHALFAAEAADGSVTLTAVAWDQIQKIVVRQVQGTPEGMFEG